MFSLFFGTYLVQKQKISPEQYQVIREAQKSARVKLGLIAVSEKLLSEKQADEINRAQTRMDKRFGDIAVEMGYLTETQVSHLLSLQCNSYLIFTQTVVDKEILTLSQVEELLNEYKEDFQFTDEDIAGLKSGDIDRICPLFIRTGKEYYDSLCSLAVRNIIRFISPNIFFSHIKAEKEYSCEHLSIQKLTGDHHIFVGFADKDSSLLSIASPFAKEDFSSVDEDAYDSVCEFINCINGLFASKLSHTGVEIDMLPPSFETHVSLSAASSFYVLPVQIDGAAVDLIVSIDNPIQIIH